MNRRKANRQRDKYTQKHNLIVEVIMHWLYFVYLYTVVIVYTSLVHGSLSHIFICSRLEISAINYSDFHNFTNKPHSSIFSLLFSVTGHFDIDFWGQGKKIDCRQIRQRLAPFCVFLYRESAQSVDDIFT